MGSRRRRLVGTLVAASVLALGLLWLYMGQSRRLDHVETVREVLPPRPSQPEPVVDGRAVTLPDPLEDIENLPIPGRGQMVAQLIEADLPLEPNYHRVTKQGLSDKSLEELVEGLGDPWASHPPEMDSISPDWGSISALTASLPLNLRAIRIIEIGRQDPERVGSLVAADLARRLGEFPETYCRLQEARLRRPGKTIGVLYGHDGTVAGSTEARRYLEDQYAISAAMWILVNLRYTKGIEAIADYCALVGEELAQKYTNQRCDFRTS